MRLYRVVFLGRFDLSKENYWEVAPELTINRDQDFRQGTTDVRRPVEAPSPFAATGHAPFHDLRSLLLFDRVGVLFPAPGSTRRSQCATKR